MAAPKRSALFICLGNICRSPMAEAVFRHMAQERGVLDKWEIDSAAIGPWHVGKRPDKRALKCLDKYGVSTEHRARVVTKEDFNKYEFIFGMDDQNMEDLDERKPKGGHTAKLELLGDYDPEKETIIVDPYYGDYEGFETVYTQVVRCCKAFLDQHAA